MKVTILDLPHQSGERFYVVAVIVVPPSMNPTKRTPLSHKTVAIIFRTCKEIAWIFSGLVKLNGAHRIVCYLISGVS